MTDALVPSLDVAALEALPLDEQIDALGSAWRRWRRLEVPVVWAFGCALRSVKAGRPGREWSGMRDRIGIARETARRYILIADSYDSAQIGQFPTVDAALSAIKALRPAPEPTPTATPAAAAAPPRPTPAPPPVEPEPTPEAAIDAAAVEAEEAEASRERAELREEIIERWAIRTEHEDGEEIERLHILLDKADARDRDRVATINAQARTIAALKRKDRDECDAALLLPPSPETDAYLAKFWNVARKRPAA